MAFASLCSRADRGIAEAFCSAASFWAQANSALFASSWLATASVKQLSTPSGGPASSASSRSTVACSLSIA
eukprot:1770895-Pyramimonas_sp.AAC.1